MSKTKIDEKEDNADDKPVLLYSDEVKPVKLDLGKIKVVDKKVKKK